MQGHFKRIEFHMANVEALQKQLVELQKTQRIGGR